LLHRSAWHPTSASLSDDLHARTIVAHVLTNPSRRTESSLRKALAANFTAAEAEHIVSTLIANCRATFGEQAAPPPALAHFAKHLTPYELRHASDTETVTFWPEDLFAFFVDLAFAAGVDIARFGHRLDPKAPSPDHAVARALMTVAQVERVYVDVPGALTETRVPRQFLFVLAAALIGIATGNRGSIADAVVAGLSGIGALLINLLAERYLTDPEPTTDFVEDLILRLLERRGPLSTAQLRAATHIATSLLRSTIKRLLAKRLIRRILTYTGKKAYLYDLAERSPAREGETA
jgi:hypothetical protein